jgi:hypothetical protein
VGAKTAANFEPKEKAAQGLALGLILAGNRIQRTSAAGTGGNFTSPLLCIITDHVSSCNNECNHRSMARSDTITCLYQTITQTCVLPYLGTPRGRFCGQGREGYFGLHHHRVGNFAVGFNNPLFFFAGSVFTPSSVLRTCQRELDFVRVDYVN